MKVIHYFGFLRNPFATGNDSMEEKLPIESICWQDTATETKYYLKKSEAEDAGRAALAVIEQLLKEGADALWEYLAQTDVYTRDYWLRQRQLVIVGMERPSLAALWPELPYPGNGLNQGKKCWRIADFLLVRAGVFHALAGDKLSNKERESLRPVGLLWQAEFFMLKGALKKWQELPLKYVDVMNASKTIAGYHAEAAQIPPELLTVDVVKGGAVKIKEYFLETNRIGEIRGASTLLDDINRRRYIELFRRHEGLTPENIMYAGGGNLFAVVPAGIGKTVVAEIERLHAEVCLTARSVAAHINVKVDELKDYAVLGRRLADAISLKQALLVPDWEREDGDITYGAVADSPFRIHAKEVEVSGEKRGICESCGIRRPHQIWNYNNSQRRLCSSCFRKQFAGQNVAMAGFEGEYDCYMRSRGLDADDASNLEFAKENDRLGSGSSAEQRGELALIYGDGNNFSLLFSEQHSLSGLRYVSRLAENAAYEAVFGALYEHYDSLKQYAVAVVALGGDDIMLFVPATSAVPIALSIGQRFDRLFANQSLDEGRQTMSLGVVIAKTNTNVRYLFELVVSLLKAAKQRAHSLKKNIEGTVDIMTLDSYAVFEDDINSFRKHTMVKGNDHSLTLRPFTYSELKRFSTFVGQLKAGGTDIPGRSWLYGIQQAATASGVAAAQLFFNYQYARLKQNEHTALDKVWQIWDPDGKPEMYTVRAGGGKSCLWADVVDLWDYVGGDSGDE